MAFALKSLSLSFLLLLALLLLLQLNDDLTGAETTISSVSTMKETTNRKLLLAKDLEAIFKIHGKREKEEEEEEGWELRATPLGPDPLHHHGADPKKPRTP